MKYQLNMDNKRLFEKTKGDLGQELLKIKMEINKENAALEIALNKRVAAEDDCVAREKGALVFVQDSQKKSDELDEGIEKKKSELKSLSVEIHETNEMLEDHNNLLISVSEDVVNAQDWLSAVMEKAEEESVRLTTIQKESDREIKSNSKKSGKINEKAEKKRIDLESFIVKLKEKKEEYAQITKEVNTLEGKLQGQKLALKNRSRNFTIYEKRILAKYKELYPDRKLTISNII